MTTHSFTRSVLVAVLAVLGAGPAFAQTPASPASAAAQPSFPATSFLAPTKATWASTRTLVLGIVEAMPEDKYDFKPTPAQRTFRDVAIHLIGENYIFFSRVSGENLGSNDRFNTLKNRDEIQTRISDERRRCTNRRFTEEEIPRSLTDSLKDEFMRMLIFGQHSRPERHITKIPSSSKCVWIPRTTPHMSNSIS